MGSSYSEHLQITIYLITKIRHLTNLQPARIVLTIFIISYVIIFYCRALQPMLIQYSSFKKELNDEFLIWVVSKFMKILCTSMSENLLSLKGKLSNVLLKFLVSTHQMFLRKYCSFPSGQTFDYFFFTLIF